MKHYKLCDEQPADVGSQPSNGGLSIIHLCHFWNKHGRNKNIKMLHTFLWKSWESCFTTQIQTTSGGQRPQHIGTFLWAEPLSHKDLLWSVNKTLDLGLRGTRCTSATHTHICIYKYIYIYIIKTTTYNSSRCTFGSTSTPTCSLLMVWVM